MNPMETYALRQSSVQLHAQTACMLIQAAYRCYRTRCHFIWIRQTMNVMLSR